MSITVSSPVTGGAQTGLTSPTATYVVDVAPDVNGKQWYVSVLGGTQTNARTHSISDPFIVLFVSPKVRKTLPAPNPTTGLIGSIPVNSYMMKTQKGVNVAVNQSPRVLSIRTIVDVPAGSDSYDAVNIRAALSAHIGLLNANSAGFGDSLTVGAF
jgi:lipid-A-disaccharide synthase-like uncharacterized protein